MIWEGFLGYLLGLILGFYFLGYGVLFLLGYCFVQCGLFCGWNSGCSRENVFDFLDCFDNFFPVSCDSVSVVYIDCRVIFCLGEA